MMHCMTVGDLSKWVKGPQGPRNLPDGQAEISTGNEANFLAFGQRIISGQGVLFRFVVKS